MKKMTMLMLLLMLISSLAGCKKNQPENGAAASGSSYEKEVETAITAIKEAWLEDRGLQDVDPYLEIKNTRIIFIKDNASEEFKNYDYVVEFILFSNYFGSAPYYENVGVNDSVVVYKDGHAEVQKQNPFVMYRSRTFESDFSNIIETIIDLGPEYNQLLDLSAHG